MCASGRLGFTQRRGALRGAARTRPPMAALLALSVVLKRRSAVPDGAGDERCAVEAAPHPYLQLGLSSPGAQEICFLRKSLGM